MIKLSLKEAQPVPFDIDGRILYHAGDYEIVHIILQPSESIAEHTNPFDVVFFIIEGIATITVDTETEDLNPSDTVFIKQSVIRGMANKTDKIVRLLVFKMM
jgi:quercetin dioxygenase-like cupin family protein